jgi:hypothetical protein
MNGGAKVIALVVLSLLCQQTGAQTVPLTFTGGGTSNSFDGWVNMNNSNSDFSNWPTTPAESNASNSGDAKLVRVSGSAIFASRSLYFLSYQQVANALGGTLRVSDPTPVAGVKTITLQVEIGEAVGYGFQRPGGYPVLKINGQPATYAPAHAMLLNRYDNGEYESPETGWEPVYVKTLGYQWNVESLGPINSLQIDFSAVTHAQIYEVRLDQSDVAQSGAVFVPRFLALAGIGTPLYDGISTSVTHSFTGPPASTLIVEYSEYAGQSAWTPSALVETGSGSFDVTIADPGFHITFTALGDRRAAWSRNMFFRAKYPSVP